MVFLYEIMLVSYISVIIHSCTVRKWFNFAILDMPTKRKKINHFQLKITCDTWGRSENSDIAGWKCKPSWIGPITIKQNHIKQE
jgi:hypothetical protein